MEMEKERKKEREIEREKRMAGEEREPKRGGGRTIFARLLHTFKSKEQKPGECDENASEC